MKHFFLLGLWLVFAACGGNATQPAPNEAMGQNLLATQCQTCHAPEPSPHAVAPDLISVRKAWLAAFPAETDFVREMDAFLNLPAAVNSQMPEALAQFGLMPVMGYAQEQRQAVATWLFRHEPNAKTLRPEEAAEASSWLEKGRAIALATKAALGKQLMGKTKQGGHMMALEFCTLHALPITDSVAKAEGVEVRRISDKPRNPLNAADERERMLLEAWKARYAEGKEISAELQVRGNRALGYYPILTEEKCLACHGNPNLEVSARIAELYPGDQATGYEVNQVRGAFRVGFRME